MCFVPGDLVVFAVFELGEPVLDKAGLRCRSGGEIAVGNRCIAARDRLSFLFEDGREGTHGEVR